MTTVLRALLVGIIRGTLLVLGVSAASAAPAPRPESTAAQAAAAAKHAGLRCRDHTAESKPVAGKVVVPKSYSYGPDTTTHTGWHNYCTKSPDQYTSFGGVADFRGPCARHDTCLAGGKSHGACDGPLLSDLKTNCRQRFGAFNPFRYDCEKVAHADYVVIKAYNYL